MDSFREKRAMVRVGPWGRRKVPPASCAPRFAPGHAHHPYDLNSDQAIPCHSTLPVP